MSHYIHAQINELDYWRESREQVEQKEKLKLVKKQERQRNAQIRKVHRAIILSSLRTSSSE